MKKTLLIALLLSVGFPQTKMDINNLIERGGLLYAPNDNKPYTGNVFNFYENGIEELNGRYRNGIKNGKWKWWNEDGGLDSTGSYKNGLMNGKWTYYHENGQIHGQGRFMDGDGGNPSESSGIPSNGRHGRWTFWHENGQKSEEKTYKKGKQNGLATYWYSNGQKEYEGTYKDGKLDGLMTEWYENGQKQTEETYKHDELISSKSWNKDGSIIKNVCISTDFGIMILELYPEVAPKHVESFIQHVKNGYYNGTTFHRVIPGFVIQGGDPNSRDNNRDDDGQGGHAARYFGHGDENVTASWTLPAEFNERPHITGALSMARSQENNSAGSQFFICAAPVHRLDNRYTVFGQVISGLEVIQKIVNVPRDRRDNPSDKIEMEIDICEK
jgi:peptidyl-prolyl cis-trans isomerase B (cyclophilin B)